MYSSRGFLPPGWCRVEVPRRITNTPKRYDVYFYSHDGVKFRSFPEIKRYFEESKNAEDIERSQFNFIPVQTPVLRESCDVYEKLEHQKYLTLNKERLKKLFANEDSIILRPDMENISVYLSQSQQSAVDQMGELTNNPNVLDERRTKSQSHFGTGIADLTLDEGQEKNGPHACNTKGDTAVKNLPDPTYFSDCAPVSCTKSSLPGFGETIENTNVNSHGTHHNSSTDDIFIANTEVKETSPFSAENQVDFGGSSAECHSTSFSFGKKRKQPDYGEIKNGRFEPSEGRSPQLSSRPARKGRMLERKQCTTHSKYFKSSSSAKTKPFSEAATYKRSQRPLHVHAAQRHSKRALVPSQKKCQTVPAISSSCSKLKNLKTEKNAPLKTEKNHILRVSKCDKDPGAIRKARKNGSKLNELWLQCHRYSDTEKIDFIQRNKTWSTSYVTKCRGKLNGWTRVITQRQTGSSSGSWDVLYRSPGNERFRSKPEIRRFFEKKSININPDLFCFKTSVLDFSRFSKGGQQFRDFGRNSHQTQRKKSKRASKRECKCKRNSSFDSQRTNNEECSVPKLPLHKSNGCICVVATGQIADGFQNQTQKQLKSVKDKQIIDDNEEGSFVRRVADCIEHCNQSLPDHRHVQAMNENFWQSHVYPKDEDFSPVQNGDSSLPSLSIAGCNHVDDIAALPLLERDNKTSVEDCVNRSTGNISCGDNLRSIRNENIESLADDSRSINAIVRTDEHSGALNDFCKAGCSNNMQPSCLLDLSSNDKTIRHSSFIGVNRDPCLPCPIETLPNVTHACSPTTRQIQREIGAPFSSKRNFSNDCTIVEESRSSTESSILNFSSFMNSRASVLSHCDAGDPISCKSSVRPLMLNRTLFTDERVVHTSHNTQMSENYSIISKQCNGSKDLSPRTCKRVIKFTDKALQFFREKTRNCKKKTRKGVSGNFRTRCSMESSCIEDRLATCPQDDDSDKNVASYQKEIAAPGNCSQTQLVGTNTNSRVAKVSENFINQLASAPIKIVKSNDRYELSNLNEDEKKTGNGQNAGNAEKETSIEACDVGEKPSLENIAMECSQQERVIPSDFLLQNDLEADSHMINLDSSLRCDGEHIDYLGVGDSESGKLASSELQVSWKEMASDDMKNSKYFMNSCEYNPHKEIVGKITGSLVETGDENGCVQRSNDEKEAIVLDLGKSGEVSNNKSAKLVDVEWFPRSNSNRCQIYMQDSQESHIRTSELASPEIGGHLPMFQLDETSVIIDSNKGLPSSVSKKRKGFDRFQKDISQLRNRKQRTVLRSPYFRNQKKSKCKVCKYDIIGSGSLSHKTDCLFCNSLAPDRISVCKSCEKCRYSSVTELLGNEKNTCRQSYSSENVWYRDSSHCHILHQEVSAYIAAINKKHYFESLGLIQLSRVIREPKICEMGILCNKFIVPYNGCINVSQQCNGAVGSQYYAVGLRSVHDEEETPSLHSKILLRQRGYRRLGIQRTCPKNIRQLKEHTLNSPNFRFIMTTDLMNRENRTPIIQSSGSSAKNGKSLNKHDNRIASAVSSFHTPEVLEEACVVKAYEGQEELCHLQIVEKTGTERSWPLLWHQENESNQSNPSLWSDYGSTAEPRECHTARAVDSSFCANAISFSSKEPPNAASSGVQYEIKETPAMCTENGHASKMKQLRGKHTEQLYIPPKSPYGLIQEELYENPWKLLIACLFLNRTTGKLAIPFIWKFFELWPDPEATMNADWHKIEGIIFKLL